MARERFQDNMRQFRSDLGELAGQTLDQVERAIRAWEDADRDIAEAVIDAHDDIAERRAEIEERILTIHILEAPIAEDARVLHVGLIAAVALERVARLAVEIARLALRSRPFSALPAAREHIQRMGEGAVDAFSNGIRALTERDDARGERAGRGAEQIERMQQALVEMAELPEGHDAQEWFARAVLVGRHLDRIANNGGELGRRAGYVIAAPQRVSSA